MKKSRILATAASAAALATCAASFAVLGGGSASAAGVPSSAYGLELTIAGNSVIGADTIAVESTDGTLVTDSLIGLPDNPVLSGGVVNVSAQNGAAESSVTALGVGSGLLSMLPAELTGQLESACTTLTDGLGAVTGPLDEALSGTLLPGLQQVLDTIADAAADTPLDLSLLGALDITKLTGLQLNGLCDVLGGAGSLVQLPAVVARCTGDTGTMDVVDGTEASALGLPLALPTEPNGTVEIPSVVKIVANEQIANADGTFTVNALHVTLLGQIDLVVASATCGEVTSVVDDPSDAPTPTPVESHVPVTG